jgi:hypothetical protein
MSLVVSSQWSERHGPLETEFEGWNERRSGPAEKKRC